MIAAPGGGGGSVTLTACSPSTGVVGTTLTLTGTNFASPQAVLVGGVTGASILYDSSTQIRVNVPVGVSGLVSVSVAGVTLANAVTVAVFYDPFTFADLAASTTTGINGEHWETGGGQDAILGTGANGSFTRSSGTFGAVTGVQYYFGTNAANPNGWAHNLGPFTVTSVDGATIYFTGDASGAVYIPNSRPRVVSNKMHFPFRSAPALTGGAGDSSSELRMNLPSVTPEFWLEYYLTVPSNYQHRIISGYPANHKFNIAGRGASTDLLLDYELGNASADPADGSTYFAQRSSPTGAITIPTPDIAVVDVVSATGAILVGATTRIRVHRKCSSSNSATDAIFKVWAGDTVIYQKTNWNIWYATGSAWYGDPTCGFSYYYLLGYANGGFAAPTLMDVDNLSLYTSDPGW